MPSHVNRQADLVVLMFFACALRWKTMAEKEQTDRRVYVLPMELVERIREYQEAGSIPSEVEAVRRLLDAALKMKDNIYTLLQRLKTRSESEKDFRVLARDVLAVHPLVQEIKISDGLEFALTNGGRGRLSLRYETYIDMSDNYEPNWSRWPEEEKPSAFGRSSSMSGGGKKSTHLDDDIPF